MCGVGATLCDLTTYYGHTDGRSREIYRARGRGKTHFNLLNRIKIAHYISTPAMPINVTTTPITAAIDGTSCSRKIPSTMPPVTSCVAIRLA
jgi:hypothetical protein